MSYETILVEQRGAVTLVTLNRPQALNALNSQVLADLLDAFANYDADPSQRCAVIKGSERAFAAGADIKEMSEQSFADMYGSNFWGSVIGRAAGVPVVVAHEQSWSFEGGRLRKLLNGQVVGRLADAFVLTWRVHRTMVWSWTVGASGRRVPRARSWRAMPARRPWSRSGGSSAGSHSH